MAKKLDVTEFEQVVLAILDTQLENEECAELIAYIADAYFERTDEQIMETTKVTVIMEIEVEDLEAFLTSSELGSIEFSKVTGANILKMEIKEKK